MFGTPGLNGSPPGVLSPDCRVLTGLQERVWRIVSQLPEAAGFALAGGAALIVSGVVDRVSDDLDIFGRYPVEVTELVEAAVQALNNAGLTATVDRSGPTYARLDITDGANSTWVDFASDVRRRPSVPSSRGGKMLHPHELAADKMLALVARAAARDFIDLQAIVSRYGLRDVIRWASDKDGGFAMWQLQDALAQFDSIDPTDFGLTADGYAQLRDFVRDLRGSIR